MRAYTLGILAKRRDTSGKALGGAGRGGFIAEFVNFVWRPLMLAIMRQNIRVVTNAGGMDPRALKIAIEEAAQEAGLDVMPVVAAVYGDDLLPEMSPLLASGSIKRKREEPHVRVRVDRVFDGILLTAFSHIEGSDDTETIPSDRKIERFDEIYGCGQCAASFIIMITSDLANAITIHCCLCVHLRSLVCNHSLNAYVGAEGIRRALDSGAQIVVTGRCVDSALVLGPLMHEFGWSPTDWNLLAAGRTAAFHISTVWIILIYAQALLLAILSSVAVKQQEVTLQTGT